MLNVSIRDIVPGGTYKHFKGNKYVLHSIAEHTETGEKLVIYQAKYEPYTVYARPYDDFISEVPEGREDNVENQRYRFQLIGTSVIYVDKSIMGEDY